MRGERLLVVGIYFVIFEFTQKAPIRLGGSIHGKNLPKEDYTNFSN